PNLLPTGEKGQEISGPNKVGGVTDFPERSLKLLRDCADSPDGDLTALLGQLAPEDDPVVALNTALFDHGAWLDLPADAIPEAPLEIVHAFGAHETPSETHSRLAIRLGANARLTLIERFV